MVALRFGVGWFALGGALSLTGTVLIAGGALAHCGDGLPTSLYPTLFVGVSLFIICIYAGLSRRLALFPCSVVACWWLVYVAYACWAQRAKGGGLLALALALLLLLVRALLPHLFPDLAFNPVVAVAAEVGIWGCVAFVVAYLQAAGKSRELGMARNVVDAIGQSAQATGRAGGLVLA